MSFVRANGGVIHYRDEGPRAGRAIVFINALGSDLRIWDDVAALLSRDFRVVRYDKRGHGLFAQELYRQRPDLFANLALSDTAAKIGDDASWDARIAAVDAGGVEAIADAVLERWFTADFRTRRADELVGWRTMLVRTPKQGYLAACGALKRADLRVSAGAIKTKTLCLVGDQD